jgi:hypothetical protein
LIRIIAPYILNDLSAEVHPSGVISATFKAILNQAELGINIIGLPL